MCRSLCLIVSFTLCAFLSGASLASGVVFRQGAVPQVVQNTQSHLQLDSGDPLRFRFHSYPSSVQHSGEDDAGSYRFKLKFSGNNTVEVAHQIYIIQQITFYVPSLKEAFNKQFRVLPNQNATAPNNIIGSLVYDLRNKASGASVKMEVFVIHAPYNDYQNYVIDFLDNAWTPESQQKFQSLLKSLGSDLSEGMYDVFGAYLAPSKRGVYIIRNTGSWQESGAITWYVSEYPVEVTTGDLGRLTNFPVSKM